LWAKLFSIDGTSTNYYKADFVGICDATYGAGYVCRYTRNSITTSKNKAINAGVFAQGPSGDADDVVVQIYIDGAVCSQNRMIATAGWTGLASTSCVQWIPPGTRTIDLVISGSTGVALKGASFIRGGVVSF
jgi:hypothetical protein